MPRIRIPLALHQFSTMTTALEPSRRTMQLDLAAPAANAGDARWSGPVAMEGTLTGDDRLLEANSLRWDTLPMPFLWAPENLGGHQGAVVVGRIDTLERRPGGMIHATGTFDMGSEAGREAARQVQENLTTGVSVDLDDVSFEVRVKGELMDEMRSMWEEEMPMEPEEPERDEEGRETVMEFNAGDEVMVTTSGRVRAATLVSIPAFEQVRITLDGEVTAEQAAPAPALSLVASAGPVNPPLQWFANPGLSEPTPITITEDGRVFGHLAAWNTCHLGYSGQCVSPPTSASNYAYFLTGAMLTAEGSEVPVGPLTVDTGHAPAKMGSASALSHYEHTGKAAAYVNVGEDAHGIWVAGTVRPNASDDMVTALRASPLSGDWRRIGTGLELVAALAVNMPGFPVPRTRALVASGAMQSLTAAGLLAPRMVVAPGQPGALSTDDLRYLKMLASRERESERLRTEVPGDDPRLLALKAKAFRLRVQGALR